MKVKIQLNYTHKKELEHRIAELQCFATLYELVLQKGGYHNPEGNIFVVQLPQGIPHMNLLNHAIASFCFLKGHTYDLVYNSYPSVDF